LARDNPPLYCLNQILTLILPLVLSTVALADMRFTEVSPQAGITAQIPTAAASWGDINRDGWPDLWVSNHHSHAASVYVNQKDGRFRDIAGEVLPTDPRADFHGAAWADFDNDGDQDLLVVTGAGGGRGQNPNYLFVNSDGVLSNEADQRGLDYPLGRGRTPLWFDATGDGLLDVVVMNNARPDGKAPSAVFVQNSNSFENQSDQLGFRHGKRTRLDKLNDLWVSAKNFKFQWKASSIYTQFEFAKMADLTDDGKLELIAFVQPLRIYSITDSGLEDITNTIELPDADKIQDIAIADFNGDGRADMYFARARYLPSDVIQNNPLEVKTRLVTSRKTGKTKTLQFRTGGEVSLAIYDAWRDPTDPLKGRPVKLFVGSDERDLVTTEVTLSPNNPTITDPVPPTAGGEKPHISVTLDRDSDTWTLKNSLLTRNIVIRSTHFIEDIKTPDFKPSDGGLPDMLLIRSSDGFKTKPLEVAKQQTACPSVAAGDFDNDMDIDLYLVCSGPVENQTNRLYENDGQGNFVLVHNAGGAAGSKLGRGNQVAVADYDRDGFLDLFVTNGAGPPPFSRDGPHQLFRNQGNKNHWLEIDLEGIVSNRDGIGAKLVIEVAGKTLTRYQDGGIHSFAQDHQRIHFGLGPHPSIDHLTIYWPSGTIQHLEHVPANQILRVKEQG
jgi:hypothetical protein